MTDHDLVRPMFALSAAGLLDAEGERRLREHVAGCDACRAELEAFAQLADGLRFMPSAPPPADLLVRTQARVAAEADRREGARLAMVAALLACILLVSLSFVLHEGVLVWIAWSFVPSFLGGAAALMLASRRRLERSAQ
jgi:predicted anti-sigma-YlaC factor YlaD